MWRRDGTDAWVLIHVEVQGQPAHDFARRMFAYYYRIFDWRTRGDELVASANPFAVVVQAHLAAQETRGAVEARQRAKIALIRGLYQRGYEREQILELIRLIDWFVALPEEQELVVRRALEAIQEEQKMAYVTSFERSYRAEGMLDGQRVTLLRVIRARFGVVPDTLEKRIATADQETLDQLTDRASTAASLDDLLIDTA